jgi:ABC-type nitrate/sulfonate/bicarbonate transport system substrate-binding protein
VKRSAHRFRFRLLPYLVFFLLMPATLLAQEKKLLRVVFVSLSWNSEIPVRVALARGIFKAQGLQIEPIFIRGGPAAIAALVSGEVDFASIGGAQAVIRSKARGLDVSIIGSISNQTNYVRVRRKDLSKEAQHRSEQGRHSARGRQYDHARGCTGEGARGRGAVLA